MSDHKILDRIGVELDQLRRRFDELRVQANLGTKEGRDRLGALGKNLDATWRTTKRQLEDAANSGAAEARKVSKSLEAGWNELLRKYRELSGSNQD